MIISKVIGGLGNQMFQYAVGRSISLNINSEFLLDISGYKHYKLHNGFELERIFNISPCRASELQINEMLGVWKNRYLSFALKKLAKFGAPSPSHIFQERTFEYDNRVESILKDAYLDGYWQSEKYFLKNREQIRKDFEFTFAMNEEDLFLQRKIADTNSVSLHIRRGDYVTNHDVAKRHGTCNLNYYYLALEFIRMKVVNPIIYVFSDDINWVKKNIDISLPIYFVENNFGSNSFKDMYFMSQCKHNIIANSSFSWWGAWLNRNPEKLVVSPKIWFLDDTNTTDLIPENWISI